MSFISGGIFTIGCACENSITYGFEVHVGGESSRIPFKFLMNRKMDWQNLEGFIYDNCCNLQRYSLNRDAPKFEKFRFLVDGCHFQGQKKLKKRDERTGSDGHLGCSESYNFMEYKKFTSIHKDGKKTAREGSRCTVFSSHWQNPLDRWTITIFSEHSLFFSVLEILSSWTKFKLINCLWLETLQCSQKDF